MIVMHLLSLPFGLSIIVIATLSCSRSGFKYLRILRLSLYSNCAAISKMLLGVLQNTIILSSYVNGYLPSIGAFPPTNGAFPPPTCTSTDAFPPPTGTSTWVFLAVTGASTWLFSERNERLYCLERLLRHKALARLVAIPIGEALRFIIAT